MKPVVDWGIKEGNFGKPTFVNALITYGTLPVEFLHSFRQMALPVNATSTLLSYKKMEIGVARCRCVADIMAMPEATRPRYILWLSDDDLMPWDGLIKLYEEMENNPGKWDVLSSLVHLKAPGIPPAPVLWNQDLKTQRKPMIAGKDFKVGDIVEADIANFGFALTRPELFNKISAPWFKSGYTAGKRGDDADIVTMYTEDCYFFDKLKKIGGKIGVHTGVRSSHFDVNTGEVY